MKGVIVCKYDGSKRCYHPSCSLIDEKGSVSVCPLYRGGDFFAPRKVVEGSIFFERRLRRGGR